MVLAEFLNRKLLEPQKRRMAEQTLRAREEGLTQGRQEGREEGRAEGRQEGRAQAIEMVRTLMRDRGIDPDEVIPADSGESSSDG